MRFVSTVVALWFAVVACGAPVSESPATGAIPSASDALRPAASAPTAAGPSDPADLTLVALGDSWPQGNHCGGCRTFAGRYADGLEALLGEPVTFVDLTGEAARESTTLLRSLRESTAMRAAVEDADIVLIATGPNEMDAAASAAGAGTCGGPDGFDCIRALGDTWTANFDAIVADVLSLRDGQPTAIRLVNAANPFISVPGMTAELGLPDDFATTGGALIFELLTDAMCAAADTHGGRCVDVRPILNGPSMDQPTDEDALESHQAIADALVATGLAELGR